MRRARRLLLVLAAAAPFQGVASAQEEERERVLCDPATQCAGELCRCLEDSLEVTFDGKERSVLSVAPADVGSSVKATVVLETKDAGIQGWSYGVRHDPELLTVKDVTFDGTDAEAAVLDAITLITYLFRHGPELAAPYAQCGADGTPDPLPCMDAPCP